MAPRRLHAQSMPEATRTSLTLVGKMMHWMLSELAKTQPTRRTCLSWHVWLQRWWSNTRCSRSKRVLMMHSAEAAQPMHDSDSKLGWSHRLVGPGAKKSTATPCIVEATTLQKKGFRSTCFRATLTVSSSCAAPVPRLSAPHAPAPLPMTAARHLHSHPATSAPCPCISLRFSPLKISNISLLVPPSPCHATLLASIAFVICGALH